MPQNYRSVLMTYIAREALPIEKYGHQPRLYALTHLVGQGQVYDDEIVFAATWLHDLGVFTGHRPEDPTELARWDNVVYAIQKAPRNPAGGRLSSGKDCFCFRDDPHASASIRSHNHRSNYCP